MPACSRPPSPRCAAAAASSLNAVTLETEALLIDRHAAFGGELIAHRHCARRAGRRQDRLAAGDAGHAVAVGQAMIVAGIGCRAGAPAADIDGRASRAALARAGSPPTRSTRIATSTQQERRSRASRTAAETLGAPLVCRAARRTRSRRAAPRRDALRARARAHRRAVRRGSGGARRRRTRSARLLGAARSCVGAARPARSPLAVGGGAMTVHFIGAGPGAADLITVRGRDLIARCPVCLYAGSLVPRDAARALPAGRAHRRYGAAVARRDRSRVRRRARRRPRRGAAAFGRPLDLERARRADPPARAPRHPLHDDAGRARLRRRGRRARPRADAAGGRAEPSC